MHHALIQKRLESEDLNCGQSTSLMATTRMETTHGLTYSVARAIEVTAWQSVDAVDAVCLTNVSCVEVTVLHDMWKKVARVL